MFEELSVVVVAKLLVAERRVDGTAGCVRQPRVGDVGTVVHVHGPHDFIVECIEPESGFTLWLADFTAEEVSAVWAGRLRPGYDPSGFNATADELEDTEQLRKAKRG